ncbi:MAG: histidine phosphatase family protein, partial [Chloroflexi bacterium]|nr:histidine phosphatase family protein [Chloroflexota bacterium]
MTVAARTTIYLVRHGETEWNQERPGYCGWTDIPLNARGRLQADALGQRFTNVPLARVLSSDMVRSRHTAEVIAASSGLSEVDADPRFRELNYGQWEGIDSPALVADDAVRFDAWQRDPGGG